MKILVVVVTTGEGVQEGPGNPQFGLNFGTSIGGEVIQEVPGCPLVWGSGYYLSCEVGPPSWCHSTSGGSFKPIGLLWLLVLPAK